MVSWSAGILPSTALATTPASTPSRRRITKVRALVGAGKIGVSRVPLSGKRISISGTTPSLTSSSAIRSGVSARLRRIGRQPLLEEVAADVVATVVDRALGLRCGAGEVDDQARTTVARAGSTGGLLGQGDPLGVQPGLVDAVVLGVVLPDVGAVRDLRQDLAPVGLGGLVEDRVEGRLDGVSAVALEQLGQPPRTHQAGRALGVEVGGQRVGHPAVAGHDPQCRLVGNSLVPQLDRRDGEPLLEDAGGVARHRPGHRATDVVVVAEGLDERHHLATARTPAP